ncbi:MAG: NADP oxidoreductase [Nitrososphaeria archaeon]|nr:NADP oxidoreductase [Nitrososphaeria archaeon]
MAKVKVATVWLSGCSGCHMSFLDQDEKLIELSKRIELVYSPIADVKEFPENVDITFIEGAVANEEQFHLLKLIRERTKLLIALGDCAVTGNVVTLRNCFQDSVKEVLEKAYIETVTYNPQYPVQVPKLLEKAYSINEVVKVDFYIPGCPPSADLINYVITEFLEGRVPSIEEKFKYG